ncbi:hypothetical protein WA026_018958 [Henosepilachna vigintioctopunctata]|uniref:ENTH domain-containing protein n=1 Tax=Henosepilachna vigintioctopunctata TaxID=420089 RepID=A0AAW1UES4_9CUCU
MDTDVYYRYSSTDIIPPQCLDLVHCTNEPNISVPQLANLLIERSQNTNWVVVYKALVTVHHMMCYGNERFTQYLASSNSTFQLSNFLDKSGVQGFPGNKNGYDMSPFIRRYAKYLNEKAISYRTVAFDFCKIKRGKEDGMLRTMNTDKLLKTLPVLQNQLDVLLEFECSSNDLTNGIINMCFMLLFKDLIRLFAGYNDGIINLLEKFFDMNKKQCKEALDIYKKFLVRMDRVSDFLKVAENVGIDKGNIPDLTKAPSSLLEALEQHLAQLDGKKNSSSTASSQSTSNQKNVRSAVTVLSSTSNAFGNVANSKFDNFTNGIDENLKLQVLAEEEAAMNQFKSKVGSPASSGNPFVSNSSSSVSTPSAATLDLFASEPVALQPQTRPSDDLLQLSNPFMDSFSQPQPVMTSPPPFVASVNNNAWVPNGTAAAHQMVSNGSFVSDTNFASVFGSTEPKNNFDGLGGVLQPMSAMGGANVFGNTNNTSSVNNNNPSISNANNQFNANGNVCMEGGKLVSGDLESSLASLAENLTINPRVQPVKGMQWNSPKGGSKTGGNWTPQPMSATTGAGYKPMNQSMASPTFTASMLQPPVFPTMPAVQPVMVMRPIVGNPVLMPQMSTMGAMSPNANPMAQQQSLLFH